MTTLHDQIINIKVPSITGDAARETNAFKIGYLDALLAAAELAIASDARIEALEAALKDARNDSELLAFLMDWGQKKFALCYREGMSWTPCKTTGPLEHHFATVKKGQP